MLNKDGEPGKHFYLLNIRMLALLALLASFSQHNFFLAIDLNQQHHAYFNWCITILRDF